MNDCQHPELHPASEQVKRLGGREFRYLAPSCSTCGAVLWNQEAEDQYREWMRENREKFVLQFSVTQSVADGIQGLLLQRYPGTADSHFVRAVLSVFCNCVFSTPELSEGVNLIRESVAYKALSSDGSRIKMKARINPHLLELVETWAALVGMTVPRFVEECLTQTIALFKERSMSPTWSLEIDRQLDTVMKAA